MKRVLVAAAACLALAACGDPIESGYVVGKSYDDPDYWTETVDDYAYQCRYEYGYNPSTGEYEFANICKNRHVGSHTERRYDGPHWYLKIRDDKDQKRTGNVTVSESEYNTTSVGDHWPDRR